MANTLDLQEQEQLDEFKAFWKQWGSLITWLITACLLAYAGWNGWGWYQRDQAAKASTMFDQLDQAALAGDVERAGRVFNDMKDRFSSTAMTQQAGLMAAKLQYEQGKSDAAKASLGWVAEHAVEDEYRAIARLRLAGVLLDAKDYEAALKTLDGAQSKPFAGLVSDRRGDVLLAQGKSDEARSAYQAAYRALGDKVDYRRLIEAKLAALAAVPTTAAGASK